MGSVKLEDTTNLGMLFNLSAHSPLRDSHRVANQPSLRLPEERLGVQRLPGRDLGPCLEVLAPELAEPAAEPETFLAVGVLDNSVERACSL